MFFDPQPWPIYIAWEGEKIDFAGVMELKSDMEMDQHSGNLGDGSRRGNRFGFVASHNHKISWDGYERFTLLAINPPRLLWIEGSLDPQKAEGHHEPSHIGPLIKLHQEKGKGRLLKQMPS